MTLTEEIGVLVVVQIGNANDDCCTGTMSEWSAVEMYSRGGELTRNPCPKSRPARPWSADSYAGSRPARSAIDPESDHTRWR